MHKLYKLLQLYALPVWSPFLNKEDHHRSGNPQYQLQRSLIFIRSLWTDSWIYYNLQSDSDVAYLTCWTCVRPGKQPSLRGKCTRVTRAPFIVIYFMVRLSDTWHRVDELVSSMQCTPPANGCLLHCLYIIPSKPTEQLLQFFNCWF